MKIFIAGLGIVMGKLKIENDDAFDRSSDVIVFEVCASLSR